MLSVPEERGMDSEKPETLNQCNLGIEEVAEVKKERANDFYIGKEYKKALAGYNEVIELCPNVVRYYGNRAACYMMLGQYRDALNDAKKCIELDPTFFKAYARIVKCCLILGDITEAETTTRKLHEIDPSNNSLAAEMKDLKHVQRYLKEADDAYAAKDFRKVVYCMDRCCDVSSSCTKFKLTKAECLVFLKRYQIAQEIVKDALRIDKQNVDALYIRGMCLYFQYDIDKAISHFLGVLRLAPDHSKALEIYKKAKNLKKMRDDGKFAYEKEQYLDAYDLFSGALAIDSRNDIANSKLHYNCAMTAYKMGRLNETIIECTASLKLDENYLKALVRRAMTFMELKEYEEAVRDFEKACKIQKSPVNVRLLSDARKALKKSKKTDYYLVLGIERNASTDDIKKAYRKRAMVHHPDRHANASEGEKKEQEKIFKEVGEAYAILSDPKKRSRYDNEFDTDDGNSDWQDIFGHRDGYPFHASGFPGGFSFRFS